MEALIPSRLTTLGHPHRLAIFRLLVRRHPDRLPAGEIADVLDFKPSTLSAYLSALMQSGLITQERMGTSLRYSVDMTAVRQTFDYLLLDCCRGRPDLCAPTLYSSASGPTPMSDTIYNVLFICSGNSARSIFAESILRTEAGTRFNAYSASTHPSDSPNLMALEVLRNKGHDLSPLKSKSITTFQGPDAPVFDFVFTVCDQAANEDCPAWQGQPISGHWGLPDPVKAQGTKAQKRLAFQQTYGALRNRIIAFAALPIASLDRISLQAAVDDLAHDNMETSA